MGEHSAIEWTDHTFSPWIGCTKVSPGCDNCYAKTLMEDRWHKVKWGNGNPRVRTKNWAAPRQWNARAEKSGVRERVFCASLADVFDSEAPPAWRLELFALVNQTPSLDWLLLTKRPHLARSFERLEWRWPDNAWLGVSCENKALAEIRIPIAREVTRNVFVSAEPLLQPIHFGQLLSQVGWVIVGGESGSNRRTMNLEWARAIRDECLSVGVPFFFKQTTGKGPIPDDLLIRQLPQFH